MTEKLKPCPFCGGEAKYAKAGWFKGFPEEIADYVMIVCSSCGATTETYKSINELTSLWNKRSEKIADNNGLKSCPNCGKKARVFVLHGGNYIIECSSDNNYECCHVSNGFSPNAKDAITAWNSRADT